MRFVAVIALCVASAAPVFGSSQAAQAGRGRGGQADANGFKVGDTVEVDTAFGWMDAQIVQLSGSNYQVRVGPNVVLKSYPVELHRKGPFTDRDHEVGLYDLKDRVQINVQGQGWVDGVVITRRALEYQVQFAGNKSAWASGTNIRYVGAPPAAATTAKAGAPPKPGFTPCAGSLEGRWGPSNGMAGLSMEIRAGKATLSGPLVDPETLECWTLGAKIILRAPGKPGEDLPMDINKDGTIETPLGELKKKGGV